MLSFREAPSAAQKYCHPFLFLGYTQLLISLMSKAARRRRPVGRSAAWRRRRGTRSTTSATRTTRDPTPTSLISSFTVSARHVFVFGVTAKFIFRVDLYWPVLRTQVAPAATQRLRAGRARARAPPRARSPRRTTTTTSLISSKVRAIGYKDLQQMERCCS